MGRVDDATEVEPSIGTPSAEGTASLTVQPSDDTAVDPAAGRRRAPKLERGVQLGRYTLVEKVGAGGMGVVYEAYDPSCTGASRSSCCHRR